VIIDLIKGTKLCRFDHLWNQRWCNFWSGQPYRPGCGIRSVVLHGGFRCDPCDRTNGYPFLSTILRIHASNVGAESIDFLLSHDSSVIRMSHRFCSSLLDMEDSAKTPRRLVVIPSYRVQQPDSTATQYVALLIAIREHRFVSADFERGDTSNELGES
jgi:hypothetical protein